MDVSLIHMRELIDAILKVRFSDVELERKYCEELLELAEKQGSTYAKSFALTYLGDYYLAMNDSVNSGKYLSAARECCLEQTYPALYMKICHLSGFYYHVINDEQNALQYYTESQAIASTLGDTHQICNAWNNIADMFERHENYEQANHYYMMAYQTMLDKDCKDARLLMMIEYNLAKNNGYIKNYNDMEYYLSLCENTSSTTDEEAAFNHIACQSGWCLLAAYRNESEKAVNIANDILKNDLYGVTDQYAIMEFLTPVALAMVNLKNSECAKKYIDLLMMHCTTNEILPMRQLIDIKVQYAQAFSHDAELLESYKSYYLTLQKILKAEDNVRASGMEAKINLLEMIKKHKTTLKEYERLSDEANLDELTGLYNRRYFNTSILEVQNVKNHVGIIMLDIDFFKQFNDTYGHISGDFALREIAAIMKKNSDKGIIPCRYGGDEFVCICINATDNEIEDFIKKVQDDVKKLAILHESSLCSDIVTLSIGYSNMVEEFYGDIEVAIKQADNALYKAKEAGRDCWRKFIGRRAVDN
ncbi:GGDEF domain-containing protein [Anaerorhabdus sp.]|uniref:GGDEF domain-containing protein n=1 Tax=Anaerorhabdus sp. TaxID=1872524 RepID=UPI002FC5C40F